jgi:hypothetical protein
MILCNVQIDKALAPTKEEKMHQISTFALIPNENYL